MTVSVGALLARAALDPIGFQIDHHEIPTESSVANFERPQEHVNSNMIRISWDLLYRCGGTRLRWAWQRRGVRPTQHEWHAAVNPRQEQQQLGNTIYPLVENGC